MIRALLDPQTPPEWCRPSLVFGVIGGLLVIPFLLRALGANPDAGFAQAVYAITGVLVAPFSGLFGAPRTLELCTLVAKIVYADWLLAGAAGYWANQLGSPDHPRQGAGGSVMFTSTAAQTSSCRVPRFRQRSAWSLRVWSAI
jgi:hypothetical protein